MQAAVEAFESERDAAQRAVTASDALISELRDKESADTISKQVVYER